MGHLSKGHWDVGSVFRSHHLQSLIWRGHEKTKSLKPAALSELKLDAVRTCNFPTCSSIMTLFSITTWSTKTPRTSICFHCKSLSMSNLATFLQKAVLLTRLGNTIAWSCFLNTCPTFTRATLSSRQQAYKMFNAFPVCSGSQTSFCTNQLSSARFTVQISS